MYHICLNANEGYIKFAAVLITSIITNTHKKEPTKPQKSRLGGGKYCFHILTDNISKPTKDKLQILQNELSLIFPCEIRIHYVDISIFDSEGMPQWARQGTNKLAYCRILLAQFLPQDLDICLYLDVDMLILSDISELFEMDLGSTFAGVVLDPTIATEPFKAIRPHTKDFKYPNPYAYFNSGCMLINLKEWRKQNIQQQCMDFLNTYATRFRDQDILNAIIGDNTTKLEPKWNFIIYFMMIANHNARLKTPAQNICKFSIDTYQASLANIKIIHYCCCPKPWASAYSVLDFDFKPFVESYFREQWWKMADKTPAFAQELQELKSKIADTDFISYAKALSQSLQTLDDRITNIKSALFAPHKFIYQKIKNKFGFK